MNIYDLRDKRNFIHYMISASYLYKYDFATQMQILNQKPNAKYVATKEIWKRFGNVVNKEATPIKLENGELLYTDNDLFVKTNIPVWQYNQSVEHELIVLGNRSFDIGISFDMKDLIYEICESKTTEITEPNIHDFIVDSSAFIVLTRLGYESLDIRENRQAVFDKIADMNDNDFVMAVDKINSNALEILTFIKDGMNYVTKRKQMEVNNGQRNVSRVSRIARSGRNNENIRSNEKRLDGRPSSRKVQRTSRGTGNASVSAGLQQGMANDERNIPQNDGRYESNGEKFSNDGIPVGVRKGILEEKETETEKGTEQVSFSIAKNDNGQMMFSTPVTQEEKDIFLINCGNNDDRRLPVIAEFSKEKTNQELGEFLKNTFQGGNGIIIDCNNISSWYAEDGIHFAHGTSARDDMSQIMTWEESAKRINELLDLGKYATNVELIEAFDYERGKVADQLIYIKRDISDSVSDKNYLSTVSTTGIFPNDSENLANSFKDKTFLNECINDFGNFIEEVKNDKSILRYGHKSLDNIYNKLKELELPRKTFTDSLLTEIEEQEGFITDDEIDATLSFGSRVQGGKLRIYNYFQEEHNVDEKANFLKKEYGDGGQAPGVSNYKGSSEYHSPKGIELQKDNCDVVFLKWSKVASLIENLIEKGLFVPKEIENENKETVTQIEQTTETENITLQNENISNDENETNTDIIKNNFDKHVVANNDKFMILDKEIFTGMAESIPLEKTKLVLEIDNIIHPVSTSATPYAEEMLTTLINDEFSKTYNLKDYYCKNDKLLYVEFNENSLEIPEFSGNIVTPELLNEFMELDQKIYDENEGYYKLYIDEIENSKVVKHHRVDLGDGKVLNKPSFDYFAEYLGLEPLEIEIPAEIEPELLHMQYEAEQDKLALEDVIGAKVGTEFIIIPRIYLSLADLENTGNKVLVDGVEYDLYKGKTFADSKRIEFFMDNGDYETYKLRTHIILKNEYLIGKTFEKDGKTYEIENFHDEKVVLKELTDDPVNSIVFSNGIHIEAFIDDYEEELENVRRSMAGIDVIHKDNNSEIDNKEADNKDGIENIEDDNKNLESPEQDIEEFYATPPVSDFSTDSIYDTDSLSTNERLNNNVECINIIKLLNDENRPATIDEQIKLSHYVGWGGLSEVFSVDAKGQFRKAQEKLKFNLTEMEYDSAYRSTTSAFYTPTELINATYRIVNKLGFKGGKILEPSMAIGNYFALMPKDIKDNSTLTGVEIDSLSSKIATYLYPSANIINTGFESANINDNEMDLTLGNVPFGKTAPYDSAYNDLKLPLHDYFIIKSLDKTRPRGLVALITSASTFTHEKFLRLAYQKANLVGAFKLPNNIFKGLAGTTVDTDLLVFQKREQELEPIDTLDFEDNVDWGNVNYDGGKLNNYFITHPEMVLGEINTVKDRFGNLVKTTILPENKTIDDYLSAAIETLPSSIYQDVEVDLVEEMDNEDIETAIEYDEKYDIQNYTFDVIDDTIYYREDNLLYADRVPNNKAIERIKGLIKIREDLKNVIYVQLNNYSEVEIENAQSKLLQRYTEFVKENGRITSRANKNVFQDDTTYPLLESLEELNDDNEFIGLADIFTKRTIVPKKEIKHVDNIVDSLSVSMQNKAKVDIEYMSELTGKNEEEIIKELEGLIYKTVDGKYVTNDEYLSGNIGKKIKLVEEKIESIKKDLAEFALVLTEEEKNELNSDIKIYSEQLELLKKTLPPKLDASEIEVQIGSRWIEPKYYDEFICEVILNNSYYTYKRPRVEYAKAVDKYNISKKNLYKSDIKTTEMFGTLRLNALEIIEKMLNMTAIEVKDKVSENKYEINKEETLLAQQKAEEINSEFADWIFKDDERRKVLVDKYNSIFNVHVNRRFDGNLVSPVGMNQTIILKDHQKNAVARQLYSGRNTLLAHSVGAGKTYTMIAACMEKKRIGLINKGLFVVPKPLVEQWAREFQKLYPSAKILVTRRSEFQKKKRKRFCSKIATGEYDAIIMSHEQFGMIPLSNDYLRKQISRDLADLKYFREQAIANRDGSFTVKKITREIESLEKRLNSLSDMTHDDVLTFEELGVDALFVDEAHEFKNLLIQTSLTRIRGVQIAGNKKTTDMLYKTRYLNEKTNYSGITFATGTPVTNTLCELYSMMRYLQPDQLREQNIEFFDSWVAQYGVIENSIDMSVDGSGYNMHQRFTRFKNTSDLINVWHTSADVIITDDLDLDVPEAEYNNVEIPLSPLTQTLIDDLGDRIDSISNHDVDPTVDNMLLVTNDGRTIALDTRLIDESLVNEITKSSMCAEKAYEIYQATQDILGTQLIFCDQSVPSNEFNIYDELKRLLVDKGIPDDEIKYIHDADGNEKKLQQLFQSVKEGKVRILIGSTRKMGQGMNVQDRLVALHHMDVPWRPADLEQREGRIIRRGNNNENVEIYRYIAKGTFDAYSWDKIIQKQKGINQLLTSKTPARTLDSFDTLTFEASTAKAIAINNPIIKEKAELDASVMKLEQLRNSYKKKHYAMEDELKISLPKKIKSTEERINNLQKDIEFVNNYQSEEFSIMIKDKVYTDKREAGQRLMKVMAGTKYNQTIKIGEYKGFDIYHIATEFMWDSTNRQIDLRRNSSLPLEFSSTELGNFVRMDNLLEKLPGILEKEETNLETYKTRYDDIVEQLKLSFKYEDDYKKQKARLAEIDKEIQTQVTTVVSPLEQCKKLVKNYLRKENMMSFNYNALQDMNHLILFNDKIDEGQLKVELDFENLEITKTLNGNLIDKESYSSADELLNERLSCLEKEDLIDISNLDIDISNIQNHDNSNSNGSDISKDMSNDSKIER